MLSRTLFSWLLGLLSALLSLPAAIATGPAGAYERIGPIYQTYRIAVAAWGPDQQKILPGLAALGGSHKAGGANLKEMLNYLDKQNYDDAFFKDEGVTDLDDPDPHKAARALFFNGEIGLFKLANVFAGEGKSLPSTLEKVRTVLVDASIELQSKGKIGDIKTMIERLDMCHIEILKLRQGDMEGGQNGAKGMAKDIKTKWPNAEITVKTDFFEHAPEVRIFSIDIDATMANPKNAGMFQPGEVAEWVRGYGSRGDDKPAAQKHFAVIQAHRTNMEAERLIARGAACL